MNEVLTLEEKKVIMLYRRIVSHGFGRLIIDVRGGKISHATVEESLAKEFFQQQ